MPAHRITKEYIEIKSIPEPMSGCWLWLGFCQENGYGQLHARSLGERTAHRASYVLHRGDIPKGSLICHKCDTPSCVNPDHLFIGTAKSNMEDMSNKNRHRWSKIRFCKRGHSYGDNLGPNGFNKEGKRVYSCMKCKKINMLAFMEREKCS